MRAREFDRYARGTKSGFEKADAQAGERKLIKSPKPLIAASVFALLAACSGIAPEPSPDRLRLAGTTDGASPVELVKAAKAQELPVPCYAFQRDVFGGWYATEPLSMNTRIGLLDVQRGRVGNPVEEVLNARCR